MTRPERIGPLAGLLTLAFLLLNLFTTRSAPDPDSTTAHMVSELLEHRNTYIASAVLILMQAFFLLIFAAAVASVVAGDLWLGRLASLGGGIASAFAMASAISLIAAVFTADHGQTPAAWAPLSFHSFFLASTGVPMAIFMLGIGVAALSARTLHRVLARACIPIGIGIAFGGLYGFGGEVDGGAFGAVWVVSGLALFVWIIAVSIALLRRSRGSYGLPVPQPAST
jgi:hypothetical protein